MGIRPSLKTSARQKLCVGMGLSSQTREGADVKNGFKYESESPWFDNQAR